MKNSLNRFKISSALTCLVALLLLSSGLLLAFAAEDGFILSADGTTAKTAQLSWNAVEGADGYRVYLAAGEDSSKSLGDTEKTSFTASGLEPKTSFTFFVRAYTQSGAEKTYIKRSNRLTVKTSAPGPIENLRAAAGATSVELSWNAVSEADGYRIYLKNEKGSFNLIAKPQSRNITLKSLPRARLMFSRFAHSLQKRTATLNSAQ